MKPKNRPKAILKTLSALSVLLPASGAHAADGPRELRPKSATSARPNASSTEKKKDNEKAKMDAREFEKVLLEKGNPVRESFDSGDAGRTVICISTCRGG